MITNSQKLYYFIQIIFLFTIIPILNQFITLLNYFHFQSLNIIFLALIGIMKISLPFLVIILITNIFCQKKISNYYIIIFTALLISYFFNSDFFFSVNNINYHFLLTNIFSLIIIGIILAYLNDNFAFKHENSFQKIYLYLIAIIFICTTIFYLSIYISSIFSDNSVLVNFFAHFSDQTLYVFAIFFNYVGSIFSNIYSLHNDIINFAIFSNLDACSNLTTTTCKLEYTNHFAQILNVILIPSITFIIIYLKIRQNNYRISKIPFLLSLIFIIFFRIEAIFYILLTLISIPLLLIISLISTINVILLPHLLDPSIISNNPIVNLQLIFQIANFKDYILFLFLLISETTVIYLIIFKAKLVNVSLFRQVKKTLSDSVHLATLHHDLNGLMLILDFSSINHIELNENIDIVLNKLIEYPDIEFVNFKLIAKNDLLISINSYYQDEKEIYEQLIHKHYEYVNNEFQASDSGEISEIIN